MMKVEKFILIFEFLWKIMGFIKCEPVAFYTLMDLCSISVSSLASEGHKQSLLTLLQEEQVEQQ